MEQSLVILLAIVLFAAGGIAYLRFTRPAEKFRPGAVALCLFLLVIFSLMAGPIFSLLFSN